MTMSVDVHRRVLAKEIRLQKIKQMLATSTYEKIGEECGVSEKTIWRDVQEWVQSGGFDEWLRSEFFDLHRQMRSEKAALAYTKICDLLSKTFVQKQEISGGATPVIIKIADVKDAGDNVEVPPDSDSSQKQ